MTYSHHENAPALLQAIPRVCMAPSRFLVPAALQHLHLTHTGVGMGSLQDEVVPE